MCRGECLSAGLATRLPWPLRIRPRGSTACREAGPWPCPSRGNRFGCSRAGPGPQRNLGAVVATCPAPGSYGRPPVVIVGGLNLIREGFEGSVKQETIPDDATVDPLW